MDLLLAWEMFREKVRWVLLALDLPDLDRLRTHFLLESQGVRIEVANTSEA